MVRKIFSVVCLGTLFSGCATSRFSMAEGQLNRREYLQALRTYLKVLEPHAREGKRYIYYDRDAVTGIGTVYWNMQRYETAARILGLVNEKDPAFGKAHFYAGLCQEALGNDDAAAASYRQYANIDVADPYRQALAGRLDFLTKRKIARDIELAVRNEAQLDVTQSPEKSVGVLPFMCLSDDRRWEPLQRGLAELVVGDLAQIEGIQVVDRLKMEQLVGELGMGPSAVGEPENALRLGKFAGARYLVKGSYLIPPDESQITIEAGLIPVQNVEAPTALNAEGNLSQLFQMEKQMVLKIVEYFGITLTPQERRRILDIPTQDLDAFLSYCRGLEALDMDDYRTALGHFQKALQMDPYLQKAKDWSILPELWDATHAQNLNRVDREVTYLTHPGRQARLAARSSAELVSTSDRLNRMGQRMNAGFLPGNDARKSVEEAKLMGAPILPSPLGSPPNPPNASAR